MRIPFETPEEKDQIVADQLALGYYLKATQYHVDGKWLLFKKIEPTPQELKDMIDAVNNRIDGVDDRIVLLEDRVELLENP